MRCSTALVLVFLATCGGPRPRQPAHPLVATFSIVARDTATGDVGVAVQSKVFGAGVIVPWVRADVGAVATQALANPRYGPDGLEMLDDGLAADDVIERLIEHDYGRERRQVGVVDYRGRAAAFTGKRTHAWAGHHVGEGYCCQGNILAGAKVLPAMAEAYEKTKGDLADRLVAALKAGQKAGGDKRGRQSAALLVARRYGGYLSANHRYIDIRVDDHKKPIAELARLLKKRRGFLPEPEVPRQVPGLRREPRTWDPKSSARSVYERLVRLYDADAPGLQELVTKAFWKAYRKSIEFRPLTVPVLPKTAVYLGTRIDGSRASLYFDDVFGDWEAPHRKRDDPWIVRLEKEDGVWKIGGPP